MNFINLMGQVGSYFGWGKKNWKSYNANILLGQKGAIWLDVSKPNEIYETIPQVKTVIDRKASMFSNMELRLVSSKGGKVIEDKDFQKLIQNPNLMQGMNEWLTEYKIQEQVYGNQFIYKNQPSSLHKYPVALSNISPKYMQPVLTGKLYDQIEIEGIISGYELSAAEGMRKFETKSILWSKLGSINNPFIGVSTIFSLKFPITNTEKAYEYRNKIMGASGALGILSNETKDAMGSIALTPEEKQQTEKAYKNKYGIEEDQASVLISSANLKWQAMSYPTKDMMLFEEVDADLLTIIDAFGLNINIFSSKNATFENVKQAILQCYTDTIQPEADKFAQALGKFIGIPEGTKLEASFEHLNIFKENKEKGQSAIKSMIEWLTAAITAKVLSIEQAQEILGNELNMKLDVVANS